MTKRRLAVAALVIAGLAGSTFTADAKSHNNKHASTMSNPSATTGANMKSQGSARSGQGATGQGEVGPGTLNNNLPPASNR